MVAPGVPALRDGRALDGADQLATRGKVPDDAPFTVRAKKLRELIFETRCARLRQEEKIRTESRAWALDVPREIPQCFGLGAEVVPDRNLSGSR